MKETTHKRDYFLLIRIFALISLFWTISIVIFGLWAVRSEKEYTKTITLAQGRSFFRQIVTTRYWNSLHGGLYAPVTEDTQPNPYLEIPHRDIVTEDGRLLTMINPAYMTRQIAEIASTREQIQFHITSLNPIRPGNVPEEWEAEALNSFKTKDDEYYAWLHQAKSETRYFRYMAPLWTEQPCLKCHSKQGYAEGDLRGGISVSIPAGLILDTQQSKIRALILGHFFAWVFGLAGLYFFFRLTLNEYRKRTLLIDQLQTTLKEVKTLKGLIPICSSCKKIRNDDGYWDQLEKFFKEHSEAEFSHGFCPECLDTLYPGMTGVSDKE